MPEMPPAEARSGYDAPSERFVAFDSSTVTPATETLLVAESGAAFVAGSASIAPLSSVSIGTVSEHPSFSFSVASDATDQPNPTRAVEEYPMETVPLLMTVAPVWDISLFARSSPPPVFTKP